MNNNTTEKVRELVSLIMLGDKQAYALLYEMFSPKLIHTAERMHISKEDAENLCQEIFLHIWQKREMLNPELSFNAYLLTILKSKLYKKAKSEARKIAYQKYSIQQVDSTSKITENQVMYEELKQISERVIETLPKQQKQIFLWKGTENITSDEIAIKLGLSKRTVENHFYQAKKTIRTEIEKVYAIPIKTPLIFLIYALSLSII